ncbi:hypothetical protein [Roseovarius aestuarii]|uniref:Uncharacterized protein n=1 Tax=Roseovarius aestuarii TaxID=475083 RepID=A0A1X7BUG6_9RHOB|nr:hypothetical protein [Roseovarius aestuarii]SMC13272.1 hypothetical protein ROA7745_03117 [Roseovarius aestuarii]
MTYSLDRSEPTRHTRLFELIRQDNIINERDSIAPRKRVSDTADMQYFLKQADRSLRPEAER